MKFEDTGKINRRQYLISNQGDLKIIGMESRAVEDYFIYYDSELKWKQITDKDGCCWTLIGEAYSVKAIGSTPEVELENAHTSEIENVYFYWTGRWTLVGNREIHVDSTGMMLQYYLCKDSCWMVSPSLNVIFNANKRLFTDFKQKMTPNASINWHPAPLTKLDCVYRMFASQKLVICGDKIEPHYRKVIDEQYREYSNDEKKKLLSSYLVNAVTNVAKYSGKKIWLASTAGYDSRVVLSALLAAKVPFSTYIFNHDNISNADIEIPKRMADDLGYKHTFINKKQSSPNKALLHKYDEHTFYSIDDADRIFYADGQYSEIPDDAITVKSVFEISRGFYYQRIPNPNDFKKKIEEQYPEIASYSNYQKSIDLWFSWVEKHPNGMDIRDRFYMEQRIGGWLSTLQQSLDMLPCTQIQIANSAAILSASYWYSQEDKEKNRICYEQIQALYPQLLEYPFNPPERFYVLKGYLKKGIRHPFITTKKIIFRVIRRINKG